MESLVPVYYQIKNRIQEWIISKEYSPGEKIPSENELAKIFNVSRLTVRQAIGILVQDKLLTRRRGEGTFVTSDAKLVDNLGFASSGLMDDLFYQVSKSKTKSVEISKIKATKNIQKVLQVEDEEVVMIKRVRMLNSFLFTYTVNYLPVSIGDQLDEKSMLKKPLLKILEVDLGYEFDEVFQTMEASSSDNEVSAKLEIPSGSPILLVDRIMYGRKKKPIEFVRSYYRGDIYKYIVCLKFDRRGKQGKWVQTTQPDKIDLSALTIPRSLGGYPGI